MNRAVIYSLMMMLCCISIGINPAAAQQFPSPSLALSENTSPEEEDDDETDDAEEEGALIEYSAEDIIVVELSHARGNRNSFAEAVYDAPDLFLSWTGFLELTGYPYEQVEPGVFELELGNGAGRLRADLLSPSIVREASGEELAAEEDVARAEGVFFVSEQLIEALFGVRLEFNLSRLSLRIEAENLFPYEITERRAQRREQLNDADRGEPYVTYEQIHDRYRLLDVPFVDLYARSYNNNIAGGELPADYSWSYNLRGAGDLGLLNTEWSLQGRDDRELDRVRFKAGRRSDTPDLLGIGATSFYVGDLSTPRISDLTNGSQGRGVEIGNFPLQRARNFTSIEITGTVQPGWEVELYRGRELLDFIVADAGTGTYTFTDVGLTYGQNNFRVVSYGPQGQVQERSLSRYVGRDMIQPGRLYYSASFTQHRTPLWEPEERGFSDGREGEPRLFSELEAGITRQLSAYSWVYSLPLSTGEVEQHTYLAAGARSTFGRFGLDGSFIKDLNSGYALKAEAQTRLPKNWRLSGSHMRMYDDFLTEAGLGASRLYQSKSRASLGGRLPLRLRTSLSVNDYRYNNGRYVTRLRHSLQRRIGRLELSNRLYTTLRDNEAHIGQMSSFFMARYKVNRRITPRSELRYDIEPVRELREVNAGLDWRMSNGLSMSTRGGRRFSSFRDSWFGSLNLQRSFGVFRASANSNYSSFSGLSLGFSLSTSLARNPLNGRIRAYDRPLSRSSGIATFIYNEIPETNPGRAGIEGAELLAGGSSRGLEADEEGMIFSTRIRSWNPTEISVKESSLLDPAMQAPPAGYRYLSRPGKVFRRELQIRITSEAEGIVYEVDGANREDNLRPLANVPVMLIRQEGTAADTSGAAENTESVAQQMRSVFDGYYIFDGIREGSYRIEVNPEWLAEQELRMLTEAYEFEVTGDGTIFRNVDIVLGPLVEEDEIDFERDAFLLTEAERQELEQELQDQGMLLPCGEEIDFGTIYFGPNGDTLDEAALEIVREHAELMFEYPELTMLIEGFTAAIGDEIYNLRLSRRRAWAVQRALVELGVHPDRMFVRGRGQIEEPCEEEDDTGCGNHRKVIAVRYSVFELLFFDQDDPTLNQAQREKLATNLDILRVCEDVQVRVEALSDYRTGPQEAFEVVQQRRDEVLEFYIDQGLPEDRIDIELGVGSRFELPVAEEPDENRTQVLTVDANTAAFFKADRQRKTYTVQLASSGVLDNARERSQALSEALGQPTNVYYKPEEDLYIVTLAIEGSAFLAEREMYRVRRDVDFRTAFLLPMEGLQDVQLGTEGLYEVRFGAFSSNEAAERVRDFINSFSSEQAVVVYSEREDVYRVITREALERDRAAFIIDEARRNGHNDLLILRLSELE